MNHPDVAAARYGRTVFPAVLVFALLAFFVSAQVGAGAPAGFACPDDGTKDVFSNVAGSTSHTIVVNATGVDKTFVVQVYDPADPWGICDVDFYDENNTPPVVVPAGKRAKVNDLDNSDTQGPRGSVTVDH